ncbi:MAG: hypothetical protein MJ060_05505, partial [Clostridia bacterium]|nr:hypothetical protein [Clostridia bacterium]
MKDISIFKGKKSTLILTALLTAFSFTIITSCELGLGSKVDTSVPTISIDYPPQNNLVIRDTF